MSRTKSTMNKKKFKSCLSICECGKQIHGHRSRHYKSKKHINWVNLYKNLNQDDESFIEEQNNNDLIIEENIFNEPNLN